MTCAICVNVPHIPVASSHGEPSHVCSATAGVVVAAAASTESGDQH